MFGGPTGSDAIEASMKLAKGNTGGTGFIAFRGGNHGQTFGALSLSGMNKYKEPYAPLLPDVEHVPYPTAGDEGSKERALEEVRSTLEDPFSGLSNPAGIWVEPIQGSGGVIVPPEGFLESLQRIARENNVPLILDEIKTGFGRTGRWFGSERHDFTPDAIALGKPMGGIGLPLSGLLYRNELDSWESGAHKGTFRGNATAMRAGTRAIEFIRDRDLLTHARRIGQDIRSRLRDKVDSPFLAEVRGEGLLIGLEFDTTGASVPVKQFVSTVQRECLENGLLLLTAGRNGSVIRLYPPLVVTERQARVGTTILVEAIDSMGDHHG